MRWEYRWALHAHLLLKLDAQRSRMSRRVCLFRRQNLLHGNHSMAVITRTGKISTLPRQQLDRFFFLLPRSFQLANQDEEEDPPFFDPYDNLPSVPAGVYLLKPERQLGHAFKDAVKLVLPFAIGGNGFARTSDGLQIGDQRGSEDRSCSGRYTELN